MEPEIKIGDLSPWHHLIFVEELADDVRDEAQCKLCREQAVGPVYKCLECDFIQHKSCPNPTQRFWEKRMKFHSYSYGLRYHLMLVEEVENRAEEEVVCWVCQEPPSLLAYKCSIPGCPFLLHKSCAELSHAVLHPQHSDHMLTLQAIELWRGSRGKDKRCNACNKLIECLYYGCRRCNVYLHPKCSAPETELELEPLLLLEDLSPWHHLIFVEELACKDKCSLCKEQVVGPVYKCLELGCGFIIHKSCPTKKDWKQRVEYIHRSRRHELILVEEVDNRAKGKVVCWACEEPVSLPAYKCALRGCTFLLHKSCTELSLAVLHPLHSDHVLTLQEEKERCNACIKAKKSLSYGCESCKVYLHNKCLPLFQISSPRFHEHRVFLQGMPDRFLCEACSEETMGFPYMCNICHRTMEKDCSDFSEKIQSTLHGHHLTFTDTIRLINKHDKVFCRLCRKQVNTRYGAYYCVKCGYILHLKCARKYEDKDATIESVPGNCHEYAIYLVEGLKEEEAERAIGPEKIQHFNHPQHELILTREDPGYDKQCEACMQSILSIPYYGCVHCHFFLHSRCAQLPTTIKRGLLHKHPLNLISQAPSREMFILCEMCGVCRDGYAYKCDECDPFQLDVQCGLIPEAIEHPLHLHKLFLLGKDERAIEPCIGCGVSTTEYVCTDGCKANLGIECANLPHVARYRYHQHLLTLTNACDNSEEYYCLICEEERDLDICYYWCEQCDFTVHSECILKTNFKSGHYVSEAHNHPLTFVQRTEDSPPCDACDEPFEKNSRRDEWGLQAVECSRCKFVIHRQCQTKMFAK